MKKDPTVEILYSTAILENFQANVYFSYPSVDFETKKKTTGSLHGSR